MEAIKGSRLLVTAFVTFLAVAALNGSQIPAGLVRGNWQSHVGSTSRALGAARQGRATRSTLHHLCASTKWRPGLWLQCHFFGADIPGGLNNARNRFQTCLRLAIDAGASLVLPPIGLRNGTDLRVLRNGTVVCTDFLWDIVKLKQLVAAQCPQLHVEDCGSAPWKGHSIAKQRMPTFGPRTGDVHFTDGTFQAYTTKLLEEHNLTDVSPDNPVRIAYYDTFLAWNYRDSTDTMATRVELFNLLPYNAQLLALGERVLAHSNLKTGFIGIHFRGEADWPQIWISREQQIAMYVQQALVARSSQPTLNALYVTCGDQTAIATFRQYAAKFRFAVYDKWDLFKNDTSLLKILGELNFDQQAIVDYSVMLGADVFFGIKQSTFSTGIAFHRAASRGYDVFDEYISRGSQRLLLANTKNHWQTVYDNSPTMRGSADTKLIVFNSFEYFDFFA